MEVRGVDEQGNDGLAALGEGGRVAKENDGEGVCMHSIRPSTRLRKDPEVLPRLVVTPIYM